MGRRRGVDGDAVIARHEMPERVQLRLAALEEARELLAKEATAGVTITARRNNGMTQKCQINLSDRQALAPIRQALALALEIELERIQRRYGGAR